MTTATQKKDYSKAYFWLVISVILGGMGLYAYALELQAKEVKAKSALEQQAMSYTLEAIELKDTLEECSLRSPDQALKLESFNMLLAHGIEQNVSHDTLRKQIAACKKTLNS